MYRILAINPGSTSTKLAVYEDDTCVLKESVSHQIPAAQLRDMVAQLDMRTENVQSFLDKQGLRITDFDMVACRCGFVPYAPARTYRVNRLMTEVLSWAPASPHASNLGSMIALRLTEGTGVPAVSPDGPSTDELQPVACVSGIPELRFLPGGHVLSAKQVCRETSAKLGIPLADSAFIVAHMGGGSSVSAIRGGRIIDMNCTDKGPMSAERCGTLPVGGLVTLCYSGQYTQAEMEKYLFHRGGLCAYTGTNDALEVENRAKAGDELCIALYAAMAYQVAKCIGEMYVALDCKPDAIILTGALARSAYLTDQIVARVKTLAPIEFIPGEREMEALAGAALRVLRGEEEPTEYTLIPPQFKDRAAFEAFAAEQRRNH